MYVQCINLMADFVGNNSGRPLPGAEVVGDIVIGYCIIPEHYKPHILHGTG